MGLTLIIIILVSSLSLLFYGSRWLYRRSVNMKNKLEMGRLFTNITHEVLTPLTILSSSIEMMREQSPQNSSYYDMMELNIMRITRLLQQILEANKSQSGDLKLLVSNGNVMDYIRKTSICVKPLMIKRNQQFSITCQPQSMLGWIDPDKLDKMIYNLLSNASKYTEEGGKIVLEVKTNSTYDHIIIKVKDNGSGIPRARQKHLFERFYDGDYRQHQTFGTGLGLALTRDLVLLHNGQISFESEEGKGTTFTIVLPINKESFAPSQIDEEHTIQVKMPERNIIDYQQMIENDQLMETVISEEDGQIEEEQNEEAHKLLVVEDSTELLLLMKQLLQRQYKVVTAMNGCEAIEQVKSHDLDLIISDVMMPEMDGYKFTEWLKSSPDYQHLPIILLTAKTQDADHEKALRIGADDYVKKPFKMGDLRLRINNIIGNRQRIQREFSNQTIEETVNHVGAENNAEHKFLQKAIDCMRQHIDDADYDREAFAEEMGMSSSSLYNKLRSITGMSVGGFIRDMRMKEVRRIIDDEEDLRVSDLAYRVGFKDPKYFATIFKKTFGMQPTEYIKSRQR